MWTAFTVVGLLTLGIGAFAYSRIRRKHGGMKEWRRYKRFSGKTFKSAVKRDKANAAGRRVKKSLKPRVAQAVARAKADAVKPAAKRNKPGNTYGEYKPCNRPLQGKPGKRCSLHTPGGKPCRFHGGVLTK